MVIIKILLLRSVCIPPSHLTYPSKLHNFWFVLLKEKHPSPISTLPTSGQRFDIYGCSSINDKNGSHNGQQGEHQLLNLTSGLGCAQTQCFLNSSYQCRKSWEHFRLLTSWPEQEMTISLWFTNSPLEVNQRHHDSLFSPNLFFFSEKVLAVRTRSLGYWLGIWMAATAIKYA